MKRRSIAFLMFLTVLFTFSACNGTSSNGENVELTESEVQTSASADVPSGEDVQTSVSTDVSVESEVQTTAAEILETTEKVTVIETTALPETTAAEIVTEPAGVTEYESTEAVTEDVTLWDTEKILAFYKDAATVTGTSVSSQQTIGLQDISVNNGQLSGVFGFVTPILSSFLSSSTTETDGITGDFNKLTVDDVSSAKAYASSKGTVIEITLNEQVDNADANINEGSVAHGISVVEDLPAIMEQLNEKGLPIDISAQNTVLTYKEPNIKAVVSGDGKIINGTWNCIVEIALSDYKFAGSAVDSTRVVLDNKITVNGGFEP